MSKKSKTSTEPSKFAKPYLQQGASALTGAYGANAGKIQGYTDSTLGLLMPELTQRFQQGDAGVDAARNYGVNVLSGQYLDSNPHLQGVIDSTNEDVADRVNAIMGLRGLSGGSNHAGVVTKELAKNTAGLRYADYARERGAQDAAAGRAGSIAAADYLPVQGLLASLNASTLPLQAAGSYAGGLGGLFGQYNTTSQKNPFLPGLVGSGLAGWASGGFAT